MRPVDSIQLRSKTGTNDNRQLSNRFWQAEQFGERSETDQWIRSMECRCTTPGSIRPVAGVQCEGGLGTVVHIFGHAHSKSIVSEGS